MITPFYGVVDYHTYLFNNRNESMSVEEEGWSTASSKSYMDCTVQSNCLRGTDRWNFYPSCRLWETHCIPLETSRLLEFYVLTRGGSTKCAWVATEAGNVLPRILNIWEVYTLYMFEHSLIVYSMVPDRRIASRSQSCNKSKQNKEKETNKQFFHYTVERK